jgi:probable HAF family extracellular repeat protein
MPRSVSRSVCGVTICSLAAGGIFTSPDRVRATVEFTITDLGTLGSPFVQSIPTSLNNSGEVVGWCKTTGSILDPFLYSNGVMTDLGSYGTGSYTQATGINDSGKIIATGFPGGGVGQEALLYTGNSFSSISQNQSSAAGINSAGQIVGGVEDPRLGGEPFIYSNGSFQELGQFGAAASSAAAINNSGQILINDLLGARGIFFAGALIDTNGSTTQLPTLGGSNTDGFAINNFGEVVGWSDTNANVTDAFVYSNGVMTDLDPGISATATSINDDGVIVGYYGPGSGAFIDSNGLMSNLSSLVSAPGWTFSEATGINDAGQIIGFGSNPHGQVDAFLLTPVPEPASTGLLLLSTPCLLYRRRR